MTDQHDLPPFQHYQQAFTAYIRNPNSANHAALGAVPIARLKVYEEIVLTNITEAVSACFPVAKAVLGKVRWHDLVRQFLTDHGAESPLFREIPLEFLRFLAKLKHDRPHHLPDFLWDLCHYEWAELAATTYNADLPTTPFKSLADFAIDAALDCYVVFRSGSILGAYDFPVHTIAPEALPIAQSPTALLVYADEDLAVQFLLLNPATLWLLQLLRGGVHHHHMVSTGLMPSLETGEAPCKLGEALVKVADLMPETNPALIRAFGIDFLAQLHRDGLILGLTS